MTIVTNDAILKWVGTDWTEVSTSQSPSPESVANDAYSDTDDTETYTNTDDVSLGQALLWGNFATMPTAGILALYAQLLGVEGSNDAPRPDANYEHLFLGTFPIDFGQSSGVDFYMTLSGLYFRMPALKSAQQMKFFIKNSATSQTFAAGWRLWIRGLTEGPKV